MNFVNSWDLERQPRKISLAPKGPKGPPPKPIVEAPVTAPEGAVTGICDATDALTRHQCRWPIGDPHDPQFHYCQRGQADKSDYCEAHRKLSLHKQTVTT